MRALLIAAALLCLAAALPGPAAAAPAAPSATAAPCCGPITADGQRLAAALDHSGVDRLWQPHIHILWQSGAPDPARPGWSPRITHCSAFAAAFAARLGIYLLRPPQHGQDLLANAQFHWLAAGGSQASDTGGWKQVDLVEAQTLANQGWLVLASVENPNPHRPGHIAVIRPSTKTMALLLAHGPQEAQAGEVNHLSTTVAQGFRVHPGAWQPGGTGTLRFYAHKVDWAHVPTP